MFHIRSLISAYRPNMYAETLISSAVLLILIADHDMVHDVLLLKRPMSLSSYAGDICLPGGVKDVSDAHLKQTVLRETHEEIGLVLDEACIIGQLDDFIDKKQRLVRPFVAIVERCQLATMQISKAEVEKTMILSLTDMQRCRLDVDNVKVTTRKPSYILEGNDFCIWGLTASILVHFNNILYGENNAIGYRC